MVMTLQVRVVVENRGLDLEFEVAAGEVLAVLGPNGAGKSTTLHSIAGLVGLDAGRVQVGDRVLTDTAAGVHVPTHDRRVGLLLQDSLLFPHLSVLSNVAFGARSGHRAGHRAADESARRWLAEVDATDLADRRPRRL
jgi:molybdate transport system ATP-binding protein